MIRKVTMALLLFSQLAAYPALAQEDSTAFPWGFERVAQLQSDSPEAELRQFKMAAIAPDGTVLVGTLGYPGFHIFSVTGEWMGNIEREGEGPGEFRTVTDIVAGPRGSIAVYDILGQRLTVLDAAGQYQDSFHLERGPNGTTARMAFAGENSFWVTSSRKQLNPTTRISGPDRYKLMLVDMAGSEQWSVEAETAPVELAILGERGGMAIPVGNPANSDILWASSPEGHLWLLRQDNGSFAELDAAGNQVQQMALELPPANLPSEYWDRFKQTAVRWDPGMKSRGIEDMRDRQRELLEERRDSVRTAQAIWYVDEHGLLVNRSLYRLGSTGDEWALEPGWFAALSFEGEVSEDVAGPGGTVACAYGYLLSLESERSQVPQLTLWKLSPR